MLFEKRVFQVIVLLKYPVISLIFYYLRSLFLRKAKNCSFLAVSLLLCLYQKKAIKLKRIYGKLIRYNIPVFNPPALPPSWALFWHIEHCPKLISAISNSIKTNNQYFFAFIAFTIYNKGLSSNILKLLLPPHTTI